MRDKNNTRIYEGDIVEIDEEVAKMFGLKRIGSVKYIGGSFMVDIGNQSSILASLFNVADIYFVFRGKVIR